MADTWIDLVAKSNLSANDLATAINTLMANERLIKGGVASVTPSESLEALIARVNSIYLPTFYEPTTNTVLTSASARDQNIKPNGAYNFTLPAASVLKGATWNIKCFSSYLQTIKSSNGNIIGYVYLNDSLTVTALQDTPTSSAHWAVTNKLSFPCYAEAHKGTANASANMPMIFGTKQVDTHNAYNNTTGYFTCPKPGRVMVFANVYDTSIARLYCSIDSATAEDVYPMGGGAGVSKNGQTEVSITAGQTISVRADQSMTDGSQVRAVLFRYME